MPFTNYAHRPLSTIHYPLSTIHRHTVSIRSFIIIIIILLLLLLLLHILTENQSLLLETSPSAGQASRARGQGWGSRLPSNKIRSRPIALTIMVFSPSMPNHPNHSVSGRSPPPENLSPPRPDSPSEPSEAASYRRRGSFSFLRRTKSGTQLAAARSPPRAKLSKKQRGVSKEPDMSREQIPSAPPRIPDIPRPTQLQTFGGEHAKPPPATVSSSRTGSDVAGNSHPQSEVNRMAFNKYGNVPIPPIPGMIPDRRGGYGDSSGRTDSITNRGRYSYASSAISTINSPRRVRRRKDPTPFKYVSIGLFSVRRSLMVMTAFWLSANGIRVKAHLLISYEHRLPFPPVNSDPGCRMIFSMASTGHRREHSPISPHTT